MPSPWYSRVIKDSKLTVFNDAGAWTGIVTKAINEFNGLPFQIVMDGGAKDHISANVVVRLSAGSGKDKNFSWAVANFDAKKTHGQTASNIDDRGRVDKAVIFLPSRLEKVSDELKMAITVHELIHACGLVEKTDHDPVGGIMYKEFQVVGGKLQEPGKGIVGMPPIRIGGRTLCKIGELWNKALCEDQ